MATGLAERFVQSTRQNVDSLLDWDRERCVNRAYWYLVPRVGTPDPATFVGVALILLLVALCASCLPARRAAKVDPMEALRHG